MNRRMCRTSKAISTDRSTYRGVDHKVISVLSGLHEIPQGDLINTAIAEFVRHLHSRGALPEVLAKRLTKLPLTSPVISSETAT
jgi:hypothetical protein